MVEMRGKHSKNVCLGLNTLIWGYNLIRELTFYLYKLSKLTRGNIEVNNLKSIYTYIQKWVASYLFVSKSLKVY